MASSISLYPAARLLNKLRATLDLSLSAETANGGALSEIRVTNVIALCEYRCCSASTIHENFLCATLPYLFRLHMLTAGKLTEGT